MGRGEGGGRSGKSEERDDLHVVLLLSVDLKLCSTKKKGKSKVQVRVLWIRCLTCWDEFWRPTYAFLLAYLCSSSKDEDLPRKLNMFFLFEHIRTSWSMADAIVRGHSVLL